MPFKGFHGHTRHTHEDKVEEKNPKEKDPKHPPEKGETAVKKEVELYNQPFEPFPENKPAHYVNRFFRRSAQTVVHCVLALSPHFYMHTDELFDWMMPYERMGALLSEDAPDYINREQHKQAMKRKLNQQGIVGEQNEQQAQDLTDREFHDPPYDKEYNNSSMPSDQSSLSTSSVPSSCLSSSAPSLPTSATEPQVSSIFSCQAQNPQTNSDVQVNPNNPNEIVHPQISHFHPPFLIIDSRREDEYIESHIHGACNIHYVPPNVLAGKKLEFTLPKWVDLDTPIITYCAVGLRSGLMVWELRRRGYKFVKVLSGGYYKWVNEGRPIYANSGELTETVLQQHKLAGLMLRKELKSEKRRLERKQALDAKVADHHRSDTEWPQCHTFKPVQDAGKRKSVLTVGRRSSSFTYGSPSRSYGSDRHNSITFDELQQRRKSSVHVHNNAEIGTPAM